MPARETIVDAVVIGAGVVGLAVARALAAAGCDPIVIERERAIGQHQSSRNSEVVHAGIYYPPGSLKARLCTAGRAQLRGYCAARGVGYRECGKLIVATRPDEESILDALAHNAAACGVGDLQTLSAAQAHTLEPQLRCAAALLSPSTAVVDARALIVALRNDAEDNGAVLALGTAVQSVEPADDGTFWVCTARDRVCARRVVNAAGLGAQAIATTMGTATARPQVPRQLLAKGTYFAVRGRPFERLIYPVPDTASLGIHVTVDLAGEVRLGPDQQWVPAVDYSVDTSRATAFVAAARRYFPSLTPAALTPAYAGVRSKVQAPGEAMADFVVQGPPTHGIAGLVNLFGIESPGLTSALALADDVMGLLGVSA